MKEEEKEIKELKNKAEEYLAGWKRERADFLNFKKAESERIEKYISITKDELVLDFLPILDNIYLAEKNLPEDNGWTKGFLGIKALLIDFLKKQGVEEIDCLNKHFNPHIAEAVEEAKGEKPGIIIEVVQRGYILNNKVIRPAKVKVTK
jgi:molecular chaperone GrpE